MRNVDHENENWKVNYELIDEIRSLNMNEREILLGRICMEWSDLHFNLENECEQKISINLHIYMNCFRMIAKYERNICFAWNLHFKRLDFCFNRLSSLELMCVHQSMVISMSFLVLWCPVLLSFTVESACSFLCSLSSNISFCTLYSLLLFNKFIIWYVCLYLIKI